MRETGYLLCTVNAVTSNAGPCINTSASIFLYVPGHMHRTCHILWSSSSGPIAVVGSRREANESQSLAAGCGVHNLFRAACGSNTFTLGGKPVTRVHHWLVAKASIKHVEGVGRNPALCLLEDLRASFAQRLRTALEPLESLANRLLYHCGTSINHHPNLSSSLHLPLAIICLSRYGRPRGLRQLQQSPLS